MTGSSELPPLIAELPRLIAITDTTRLDARALLARAERLSALARPRSLAVQLRDKQLPARARFELGKALRDITRRYDQLLIVNDRLDLAQLLDADGVHLTETSVSVRDARVVLGQTRVFRACHSLEALATSEYTEVDAAVLSPIFEPRKNSPALGIQALRQAIEIAEPRAVYALGGIDPERARTATTAGAAGVAAIGAAWSEEPQSLMAALGCL